jgi:hypothetical protein
MLGMDFTGKRLSEINPAYEPNGGTQRNHFAFLLKKNFSWGAPTTGVLYFV